MLASGRMPHAQLFLGSEGSGKLALALAFVQYLMCDHPTDTDSCGTCKNCTRIAKLIHPDFHFSYPTIGTNVPSSQYAKEWRLAIAENPYMNPNQWLQFIGAENKQGNINKVECVQIIHKLKLKSFEGKHKILLMWMPEYLGKEGNRLLKIIEEPPENTLFILVAENTELILNTILSRCQIIKINAFSDEEIEKALIHQKNIDPKTATAIAQLAEGNFNKALSLLAQKENNNAALFLDWMRKCYVGNGVQLVEWVNKFVAIGRENQKHFFLYALHFLREYLHLKLAGNLPIRLQAKELKTAQNLTEIIDLDQIEAISNLMNDCAYYIERNANPKVLLLDTSIKMNKILKHHVLVFDQ